MQWAESDRITSHAFWAVFGALFILGCTTAASFAQEPPLDVPLAGALPAMASAGCDAGLAANSNIYSNSSLYGNVAPPPANGAGINTTSDLNVPLDSAPNAGANVPLYASPLAGDNVPLYASSPGSNAPLYSGSSLSRNNSNLTGGYDVGTSVNPVPYDGTPITCRSGIPLGEWLIYPSIRAYSLYSDNLFLTPTSPLSAAGFGATPSVTAQWSNGIHTSTLYASIDAQDYPTENPINSVDSQVTFTQNYSPLPDLNFTVLGDYTHTTITSSLTSSIPSTIATSVATPTRLPNGNIQLPNGEIVSPTGQVIGNINGPSAGNGISVVNPFDQYTATATVSKVFNGADLTVSGSAAQTDYQSPQNPGTPSAFSAFTTKTITENGAVALGPLFYLYSNGAFSARSNSEGLDPNSQAYLVKGGVGTRQFGLFRASAYTGYQGSNGDTSGTAGGAIYGASLSYYPSLDWTMTAALDDTINKASAGGFSNQALSVASPEQIALSSSTNVTHASLQTQYQIGPQWTAIGNFSLTHIDYYGTPRIDNAWQADLQLNYEIWRNMTLAWEYEYTDILSNAPGQSATRNFLMMSALYRY
jgi:hypothetical protein